MTEEYTIKRVNEVREELNLEMTASIFGQDYFCIKDSKNSSADFKPQGKDKCRIVCTNGMTIWNLIYKLEEKN